MTQFQIKGLRWVRRRDILYVLGKRGKYLLVAFNNIYLIFKDKNYQKKIYDCLKVLYHFTVKFHLKAPALMHSNKGIPSLTKPKTPQESLQTPLKKNNQPISDSSLHRLIEISFYQNIRKSFIINIFYVNFDAFFKQLCGFLYPQIYLFKKIQILEGKLQLLQKKSLRHSALFQIYWLKTGPKSKVQKLILHSPTHGTPIFLSKQFQPVSTKKSS